MTEKKPNVKAADAKRFQLLWRAGNSDGTGEENRITVGSENLKLKGVRDRFVKAGQGKRNPAAILPKNLPVAEDLLQFYLSNSTDYDISLPFNTGICLAQEYTPQITNKIASYSTLAGNSVVAFGQGIRKLGLKITIIKADKFWVPFSAALEAFTILSGSPTRYLGSLYFNSFDLTNPAAVRKYKVVVESLTPIYRTDRNTTVDFDMNFLVTYDYSSDKYGRWGKLN